MSEAVMLTKGLSMIYLSTLISVVHTSTVLLRTGDRCIKLKNQAMGVAIEVVEEAATDCGTSNNGAALLLKKNDPKINCFFPFSLSSLLSANTLRTAEQC
eukprot:7134503-Ditylum_brightwellii.AAC.1